MLTFAAACFLEWGASPEVVAITWAIAGVVPFALARDFARRFSFAGLDMGLAFLLDLASAMIQLSVLIGLAVTGRLSALTACAALGAGCALPTAIWFYYTRAEFRPRVQNVPTALSRTWALGKWLLAGRVTVQVQGIVTYWISMLLGGASVTGIYAACMSVVGILNPVFIGLTNVVMPKVALAWKEGGGPGLWHETIRNTTFIAAVILPFMLAVMVAGETVMRVLYQGADFKGLGYTLTVLVAAMSVGALAMPASNALAVMERPRAIVIIGGVGGALTVVLVSLFMLRWGLLGAAYGLLGGAVVGALGRWVVFSRHVSKIYDQTPVVRVIQDFAKLSDNDDLAIARLGDGLHAETFLVHSKSGQTWHSQHSLVVKLYKSSAMLTIEMVQAQFNSLLKLHVTLNGCAVDRWKISAPQPLFVCTSPLALVMTQLPAHISIPSLPSATS